MQPRPSFDRTILIPSGFRLLVTRMQTATPSPTPTPPGIQPLAARKYDDTDPNIAYDQYWIALQNASAKNAYKGTLHVSVGIGEVAFFRFTGKGFRLGYQRVAIPARGAHFVRILHESGESINLDYIEILP